MLKIIAGKHKGRNVETPAGRLVRPTSGKVRAAVFNIATHRIFGGEGSSTFEGKRVADLFCGSGALGLEALSRGAAHVTFVDQSSDVLARVRRTLEAWKETEAARILRSDSSHLPRAAGAPFDLVFLDPPYRSGLAPKTLKSLKDGGWLTEGGVAIVELSAQEAFEPPEGYDVLDRREYGNTAVVVVRMQ